MFRQFPFEELPKQRDLDSLLDFPSNTQLAGMENKQMRVREDCCLKKRSVAALFSSVLHNHTLPQIT